MQLYLCLVELTASSWVYIWGKKGGFSVGKSVSPLFQQELGIKAIPGKFGRLTLPPHYHIYNLVWVRGWASLDLSSFDCDIC